MLEDSGTKTGRLRTKEKKREQIIKDIKNSNKESYENSEYKKEEEKFRKEHPDSYDIDNDPWEDYAEKNNIKENWKVNTDDQLLRDDFVAKRTLGTAIVSTFAVAPATAIITGLATKSGKAAIVACLGTVGALTLGEYISSKARQNKIYKKYDL